MNKINTESLVNYLQIKFNKSVENLDSGDIDSVEFLPLIGNTGNNELKIDFSDLRIFKNLKKISLNRCVIKSEDIDNICAYGNLSGIIFDKCVFEDDQNLSKLSNLEVLTFSNCCIDDYKFLSDYKKLKCLSVLNPYDDSKIDLSFLQGMVDLEKLELQRCIISNFASLEYNQNLKSLSLLWTSLPDDYANVINKLVNLNVLFISSKYSTNGFINKDLEIKNNLFSFWSDDDFIEDTGSKSISSERNSVK